MTDFRLPSLSRSERAYRALLHLYPADFRRAFTQDLVETFRDQHRDAERRKHSSIRFWATVLRDLIGQAVIARLTPASNFTRQQGATSAGAVPMTSVMRAMHLHELRFALRRLLRAPLFTITTVVVLALGIGATTAVFSLLNSILLQPLPYPDSQQLAWIGHTVQVGGAGKVDQSEGTYMAYRRHARVLSGIAITRDVDLNVIAGGATAERVHGAQASANLLSVLQVAPARGRGFVEGEDRPGAAPVVLLSHEFWQRRFGADPAAVGRQLLVEGRSRQIVGVMPPSFGYPTATTDLWVPVQIDPAHVSTGSFNYLAVARLLPGTSLAALKADLARITPGVAAEFPGEVPAAMWESARVEPIVMSMRDAFVGDVTRVIWILFGSVAVVLLIACANVANLLLVRSEARQLELAVRSALGAGLPGIIAHCVSEALVLAAAGGALGIALAVAALKLTVRFGANLDIPRLSELSPDAAVLGFALLLSIACALLVSVVPVLRARRTELAPALRGGGRGTTGAGPQRVRSALVIAQVALALVLIASSGLLARSFARLRDVEPGFDARGVVMARVALPRAGFGSPSAIMQAYDAMLATVRALPGVTDAAVADWVPLSTDYSSSALWVEDKPTPPNSVPRVHPVASVDAEFFRTMRVPVLSGRTFGSQDAARASQEVVVSRAFAQHYWKDGNALGRRIRQGITGPWLTIIGVVGDVHLEALDKPASDAIYQPMVSVQNDSLAAPRFASIVARTSGDEGQVTAAIRRIVREYDPSIATYDERSMESVQSAATARARVTLALLMTASAIALLLGAVGLYGVMAYAVSLRRREIGVRMALGARPTDVRRMISQHGLSLALAGVVIGGVVALGTTRLLRGLLFEVSPTDPGTLAATAVVLLLVAAIASWIPARRAAAVDPAEAMRAS